MNIILDRFLRNFFRLLYGAFAWTYDFVAYSVSMGRWKDWIQVVLPYIEGTCILELGHGPGHLQHILFDNGLVPIGLDISRQMGKIARDRLYHNGYAQYALMCAEAQSLPLKDESFDTIFSTFPTDYFYDSLTLSEVWRTLKIGGRYVILPAAWVTGKGIVDRFAAWLFRITGQSPHDSRQDAAERLAKSIADAGFDLKFELVDLKSSCVLILIASKQEEET